LGRGGIENKRVMGRKVRMEDDLNSVGGKKRPNDQITGSVRNTNEGDRRGDLPKNENQKRVRSAPLGDEKQCITSKKEQKNRGAN